MTFPAAVGSGKRLFGDGAKATLRLADTRMFSSGVALLSLLSGYSTSFAHQIVLPLV